jgi:glycosyltransferase involved in cell wall biosynthesis
VNLLLVCQNYHPFVGGVETHARQLAAELSREHQVSVAAVNFTASRLPTRLRVLHSSLLAPSYNSYVDGSVPVHALTPTWSDRLRMLPIAARAIPRLRRYAYHPLTRLGYRCYRPVYLPRLAALVRGADLVHSLAGGYLGWTAEEAARQSGIPFVCTPFVHPHQWGDDPTSVSYYQLAGGVIALVESDRSYLRSLGVPGEKLQTIGVAPELPSAVDPHGFRRRHGLTGAPVVLYVGRMAVQKGARFVLDAAELVWAKHPEARFLFIGPSTPESADWFRGVDPRILHLGPVTLQEKADALSACDLFCMPSISEILPTVYLEAWSYGKPVIGGTAEGLAELVEGNGAGLTVPQQPTVISRAIEALLESPDRRARMGQRGRALVDRCYSLRAVVDAHQQLYRSLVSMETVNVAA